MLRNSYLYAVICRRLFVGQLLGSQTMKIEENASNDNLVSTSLSSLHGLPVIIRYTDNVCYKNSERG